MASNSNKFFFECIRNPNNSMFFDKNSEDNDNDSFEWASFGELIDI